MKLTHKLPKITTRTAVITLSIVIALFVLLGFRLGTLHQGYSPREIQTVQSSDDWHDIWDNPINAPYKLAALTGRVIHPSNISTRITSVAVGFVMISAMFLMLRAWHSKLAAYGATIIFASSAWFLHIARLGTPDIMIWSAYGLFALGLWLKYSNRANWQLILAAVFAVATIFVPGMIWFTLLAAIAGRKELSAVLRQAKTPVLAVSAAGLVLGFGLFTWRLVQSGNSSVLEWLGLPSTMPSLATLIDNTVNIPKYLFLGGLNNNEIWLNNLPFLSAIMITLLVFGLVYYYRNPALARLTPLTFTLAISTVLIVINGVAYFHLLLPIIAIIMAGGLEYLLKEWHRVFPKNPFAHGFAVSMICLLVFAQATYATRHYFVAWPKAPETKAVFNQ